ncbi:pentapeptide repeat-containing protein [Arthrobacter pityocampae]|uniref:Pentapeptide repeat-containing protein n=1 Tax=Arthrobacter pityocampae TaxID=547334 RepID=A0A2S5IZ10_9MICC|nr:pentapeptide repeat-containing protein [Arthrobacter pityocampae]PPB49777.1 pentapeptide repeat-containing protein [Arthrobacter pityocampae]
MHSTAPDTPPNSPLTRTDLRPDCSSCFALCCTALGFSRSADFAVDKPAGSPCRNLDSDFSCTIHDRLRPRGFRGCTVFDCFGAGQNVSQHLFRGVSWREAPETAPEMFAVFTVVRQLHEMLWYLAEAGSRTYDPDTLHRVDGLRSIIEGAMGGDAQQVLALDLGSLHARVRSTLMDVSDEVRASYLATGDDHLGARLVPGADLMGQNLRSRPLQGANLRGTYLIAADLRECDLSGADLLGADLRDARLGGADLARALYLTQSQLEAARGDSRTLIPEDLHAPGHWRD